MSQLRGSFVGVFDSGAGGVSVLAQLTSELPCENYVFFGDSANAPYGEKTREWVEKRSRDIVDQLVDEGAKAIVIACNTATSAAAETLRAEYAHVPIIGMEPALKPATQVQGMRRILVMATPITLRLDKFHQLAKRWGDGHEVIEVPCPGLAARIEQGNLEDVDMIDLLNNLVGPYRGNVDAVVLGCTHYAFVQEQIRSVLGDVRLFDGAVGTSRQLHRKLAERGLLTNAKNPGSVKFRSSDGEQLTREFYQYLYELAKTLPVNDI